MIHLWNSVWANCSEHWLNTVAAVILFSLPGFEPNYVLNYREVAAVNLVKSQALYHSKTWPLYFLLYEQMLQITKESFFCLNATSESWDYPNRLSAAEGPTTVYRISISGKSSININSELITFEVLLTQGFPTWHFLGMVCLGQSYRVDYTWKLELYTGAIALSGSHSCPLPWKKPSVVGSSQLLGLKEAETNPCWQKQG